jgi:F1F0 ATPase subunit 2
MMNNMSGMLFLVFAFTTGLALGTMFFGGLWLTVKKAVASKIPAVWFGVSFLLRISIVVAGFYFMAAGNWQRLVVCLCGFVVARLVIIKLTKQRDVKQLPLKKGGAHEY